MRTRSPPQRAGCANAPRKRSGRVRVKGRGFTLHSPEETLLFLARGQILCGRLGQRQRCPSNPLLHQEILGIVADRRLAVAVRLEVVIRQNVRIVVLKAHAVLHHHEKMIPPVATQTHHTPDGRPGVQMSSQM